MTRPLALIEGDLSIPLPRPYDGLPPPFGSRQNLMRDAVRRAVSEATRSRIRSIIPPSVKHVLFYNARPQRIDTSRYDAALEEAKQYLEAGNIRHRSSRGDRVLSASIFAGCTIALTWLLITCSMKHEDKAKALAAASTAGSVASQRTGQAKLSSQIAIADTQRATAVQGNASPQTLAEAGHVNSTKVTNDVDKRSAFSHPDRAAPHGTRVPKSTRAMVPKQAARVMARSETITPAPPATRVNHVKVQSLHGNRFNESRALNHELYSPGHSVPSVQRDLPVKPLPAQKQIQKPNMSAANATPWLNWTTAQQRPIMRAATPVESHWSDHMTQRRITDDPAAFNVERGAK